MDRFGNRNICPYCTSSRIEYLGCDKPDPNDGSDTSVYQLWGYFHFVSDVGDGNCIGCIEEDQTPRHGKKLFSEIKKYGIFVCGIKNYMK